MNSKMMLCSGLGTKILGDGRGASCKICLLTAGKCPEVSFKISNGVPFDTSANLSEYGCQVSAHFVEILI